MTSCETDWPHPSGEVQGGGQRHDSRPLGTQGGTWLVPLFSHPLLISCSSTCLSLTPRDGSWQTELGGLTQGFLHMRSMSCDLENQGARLAPGILLCDNIGNSSSFLLTIVKHKQL